VLSGGKVAAQGTPRDVVTPELLERHFRIRARVEHLEDGVLVVPIAPV
jgi:iron complex transport system ATP-binding protein